MKIKIKKKPRAYIVGFDNKIQINDFGKIALNANEQITFINGNKEYDFGMKSWGYYSTPSINTRLKKNSYETFLIKNMSNQIYLVVVDKFKKKDFQEYIHNENLTILLRLDNFTNEESLINQITKIKKKDKYCKNLNCRKIKKNISTIFTYNKRPLTEPDYKIKNYQRKVVKCNICNHFYGDLKFDIEKIYNDNYSLVSHGENLEKKFIKIKKLGKNSDNFSRVLRFLNFFKNQKNNRISLLDVGSGLSVFLDAIKKKVSWKLCGIEPGIEFVNFARKKLGLEIYHSNFKKNVFKNKKFNIISLNKVAEHVKNPLLFFKNCKDVLTKNGFIYVEVPDGQTASEQRKAKYQEEFGVEHLHIFSLDSLYNSLTYAGFKILKIDKIKEKSGKYTIYAFAKKKLI